MTATKLLRIVSREQIAGAADDSMTWSQIAPRNVHETTSKQSQLAPSRLGKFSENFFELALHRNHLFAHVQGNFGALQIDSHFMH